MATNLRQDCPVNGHASLSYSVQSPTSRLRPTDDEEYDLICVGFGPASLSVAIALHDAIDADQALPGLCGIHRRAPKVLFLERQDGFAWHPGMLLPGAKMQINFIKDLATMRNPRSEFTFLNYLHKHNRLTQFTNLDTFLPQRIEYEDYMKWCANTFDEVVEYRTEVLRVVPIRLPRENQIESFNVETRRVTSGVAKNFTTKNVIVAVGGKPSIPAPYPQSHERVIHSSWYLKSIDAVLDDSTEAYSVAIVGSGQSAAEIFNDLHSRYPNAKTRLLIRGTALRPSDDSPFVNEIFDPNQVDHFYRKSASVRNSKILENRCTNYGVVRGELLQRIYDDLYMQRIKHPHESEWRHRILTQRFVNDVEVSPSHVRLHVHNLEDSTEEILDADVIIVAAGYLRDMHETILDPLRFLTADGEHFKVDRDYRVQMDQDKINEDAGIWLQGCNENTHGLSDTLLSILATRSGDLIKSIFGDK